MRSRTTIDAHLSFCRTLLRSLFLITNTSGDDYAPALVCEMPFCWQSYGKTATFFLGDNDSDRCLHVISTTGSGSYTQPISLNTQTSSTSDRRACICTSQQSHLAFLMKANVCVDSPPCVPPWNPRPDRS